MKQIPFTVNDTILSSIKFLTSTLRRLEFMMFLPQHCFLHEHHPVSTISHLDSSLLEQGQELLFVVPPISSSILFLFDKIFVADATSVEFSVGPF